MDWPNPELAALIAVLVLPALLFVGCGDPLPPDGPPQQPPPAPPPTPPTPPTPPAPPTPPPTPTTAFQLNLDPNLQQPAVAQPQLKVRRIESVFWTLRDGKNPTLAEVSFPLNPLALLPVDANTVFISPSQPPLKTDARNSDIGTRNEVICTVTLVLRLDDPDAPESTATFNSALWLPLTLSANHVYRLSSDLTTPDRQFILTFVSADG
ncbi:MAG: hypothetical protein U0821_27875 [Chloroflexota bacterium]